jgi:putative molybdopterin biosynthesis protein
MESTLLTAEEVAQQLRIKKYTVYEIIKRGELASCKVGKQVRVSQADIDAYLYANKSGPRLHPLSAEARDKGKEGFPGMHRTFSPQTFSPQTFGPQTGSPAASLVREASPREDAPLIICGQDACLDLLVAKVIGFGGNALRSHMGSYNALYTLYHDQVTMSAAHLWDSETDTYNYPFIRRLLPGLPVGVLRLAGRMQGFYVKEGNPFNIRDWQDLARPDIIFINRELGCGTRILLDQKLRYLGIDGAAVRGYTREASSHMICAGIVAQGGADLGCGCERSARNIAGIEFIPLQQEWYDLVFPLRVRKLPAVNAIISYITGPDFKQDLETMGGYDISQTAYYEEF